MDVYYKGELLSSGDVKHDSLLSLICAVEEQLNLTKGQSLMCYVDGHSVFDFSSEELVDCDLISVQRIDFDVLLEKESGQYAGKHLREQIRQIEVYFVDLHYMTKELRADSGDDTEGLHYQEALSDSEFFIRLSALFQKIGGEFSAFFSSLVVFLKHYKVSFEDFAIGGDRLEFFIEKFLDEIRTIQMALDLDSFELLAESLHKLQEYFHDLKVMYHELMSAYGIEGNQGGEDLELS